MLAAVRVRAVRRGFTTVTHIWVDHPASAAGGRALWSMPKQLAMFRIGERDGGFAASAADPDRRTIAALRFRGRAARPGGWRWRTRTAQQPLGGQGRGLTIAKAEGTGLGRARHRGTGLRSGQAARLSPRPRATRQRPLDRGNAPLRRLRSVSPRHDGAAAGHRAAAHRGRDAATFNRDQVVCTTEPPLCCTKGRAGVE